MEKCQALGSLLVSGDVGYCKLVRGRASHWNLHNYQTIWWDILTHIHTLYYFLYNLLLLDGNFWYFGIFFGTLCYFFFSVFFELYCIWCVFFGTTGYYKLVKVTTAYHPIIKATAGYCKLLTVTTEYYRLLQASTVYYRLLQVTIGYYRLLQILKVVISD